jgi:hypothetical protein
VKEIFPHRCTHKESEVNCTKCLHYEKEEGATMSLNWGQCRYNGDVKNTPGYIQGKHAPMITNVDTCPEFMVT